MKCAYCGAELLVGAKYCVHCGQTIAPAPNMNAEINPGPVNNVQNAQTESKSSGVLQSFAVKVLNIPAEAFNEGDSRIKAIVIIKGIIDGIIGLYFSILILLFLLSLAGCSSAVDSATILPFLAVLISAGVIFALVGFFEKKYYQGHEKTAVIDAFDIIRTILLVIAFIVMINVMSPEAKAIRCVQKGHFEAYPNTTIEEAFNEKFQGGTWSAKKIAGDYLVTYQGRSVLFGLVDVEFWVSLQDSTFYMDSVSVDDYELNLIEYAAFITQLFEADNSLENSYQIDKLEKDDVFILRLPDYGASI